MLVVNTDLGYYMETQVQENPTTGKRELVDTFTKDLTTAKVFYTEFHADSLAKQFWHITNVRVEYIKGLLPPKKKITNNDAQN